MSPKPSASPSEDSLLISTLHYRKVVGFMGVFLTPALYIFAGNIFPHSISDYYHTASGNIFVGVMCAIGVFLCCYKGYDLGDHVGSTLAGAMAVLVGLCPTAADGATGTAVLLGKVHWTSAFTFFLSITYLCLFQFVQTTKKGAGLTHQKKWRNFWYRFFGSVMLASLAGLLSYYLWPDTVKDLFYPVQPVLLFETIAVAAFGFAWLIKGEALVWDKGRNWLTGKMGSPGKKS